MKDYQERRRSVCLPSQKQVRGASRKYCCPRNTSRLDSRQVSRLDDQAVFNTRKQRRNGNLVPDAQNMQTLRTCSKNEGRPMATYREKKWVGSARDCWQRWERLRSRKKKTEQKFRSGLEVGGEELPGLLCPTWLLNSSSFDYSYIGLTFCSI